MSKRRTRKRSSGFTLIELVVVMVLLAILAVVLLPVITRATDHEDFPACAPNLRSIGVATAQYVADHNGRLPHVGAVYNVYSMTYILIDRQVALGGPYQGRTGAYTNLELLIAGGYLGARAALHCPFNKNPAFQDSHGDAQHVNIADYLDAQLLAEGGHRNIRTSFIRQRLPESDESAWEGALADAQPEKAWLTDVFTLPSQVLDSHGDSVNVLYGTGSVRPFAYDPFEPPFSQTTYGNYSSISRVWVELDQN